MTERERFNAAMNDARGRAPGDGRGHGPGRIGNIRCPGLDSQKAKRGKKDGGSGNHEQPSAAPGVEFGCQVSTARQGAPNHREHPTGNKRDVCLPSRMLAPSVEFNRRSRTTWRSSRLTRLRSRSAWPLLDHIGMSLAVSPLRAPSLRPMSDESYVTRMIRRLIDRGCQVVLLAGVFLVATAVVGETLPDVRGGTLSLESFIAMYEEQGFQIQRMAEPRGPLAAIARKDGELVEINALTGDDQEVFIIYAHDLRPSDSEMNPVSPGMEIALSATTTWGSAWLGDMYDQMISAAQSSQSGFLRDTRQQQGVRVSLSVFAQVSLLYLVVQPARGPDTP